MSWPTGGTLDDGWEDLGTDIGTAAQAVPLPVTVRARWYDPAQLAGLGDLLASVGLTFGDALVEVRQRSRRLEATLTRRDLFGVALLDSFEAEVLEGAPCSVLLTVYEDDKETIAWEVSTDPDHAWPYLVEPDDYGEQELDVAKGSAAIGTVSVTIVDRRQVAGDQDSGYVTERLAALGAPALAGRRARLVRFIEPALGHQVIADGPIGTPELDSSYAAFSFAIRDTRETERKSRLTGGGDRTILPYGTRAGYGYDPDANSWLIDPAGVLVSTVQAADLGATEPWTGYGFTPYMLDLTANDVDLRTMPIEAFEALENVAHRAEIQAVGGLSYYILVPVDAIFEWRLAGSSDPFTQVALSGEGDEGAVMFRQTTLVGPNLELYRTGRLYFTEWPGFPAIGQNIEFRIAGGRGPLSPGLPFYVDGLTAGEFVRNAYDGHYSDRGPLGEVVATGIRYDEAALLQMTDPVRIRLTAPADDLRAWLEENIFAPTGWVPALDFDGRVSPISQNVPTDVAGLEAITDAIAEPSAEWTTGELVYNAIRFTYHRDYRPTDPEEAETPDGLADREVVVEYEDSVSVARHGRKTLELKGTAFRAVGDANAAPIAVPELGALLATDRGTQLLNRYSLGAATVRLAVMRRALPLLRAGDWVVVSLSWLPDYVTGKRGLVALCQVVALGDLDCAWRRPTLEVVTTLAVS